MVSTDIQTIKNYGYIIHIFGINSKLIPYIQELEGKLRKQQKIGGFKRKPPIL